MAKIKKVFQFILPISRTEYNIGNRYVTVQKYLEDKSNGYKITLVKKELTTHDVYGKVETTTKHLHLHSRIPYVVRKCIPDAACILTETSYYNDKHIHTSYKNNHFSHDVFNIKIETQIAEKNPFSAEDVETIDLSNGKKSISCFKSLNIEVNNWIMGWIANEIFKNLKKELRDHHISIVDTRDDWKNINMAELNKTEDELFQ